MNSAITNPSTTSLNPNQTPARPIYHAPVDVVELPGEVLIYADMPGSQAEQINVDLSDGVLTVRGPVSARQPEDQRFLLRQYGLGDYYVRFRVAETIDTQSISADYTDGVLTLRMPKRPEAQPRRIDVRSN